MSKVNIIHVTLEEDIDAIVEDDLLQISTQNKTAIDAAIKDQVIAQAPSKKTVAKRAAEAAAHRVYLLLEQAKDEGEEYLLLDDLLKEASPISSPVALVMRLKSVIKEEDKEYILDKKTVKGKAAYRLVPYNAQ